MEDEMNIFGIPGESALDDGDYQVAPIEEEDTVPAEEVPAEDDKDIKPEEEEEYIVAPKDEDDLENSSKPESKNNLDDKDNSSNTLSSIVNALVAEEVLSLGEDQEVKTVEDFYDIIQENKEKYLQEHLESFPETGYREAFEAIRAGVPIEEVLGYQANTEKYNSITEDVITDDTSKGETIRKQVLLENFVSKGFSKEKAERFAKRSFDAGEDIEDAKDALLELKAVEKAKFDSIKQNQLNVVKEAETARKESIKNFESYLKDTKEIIPGHKVTPKYRKELYDSMTKGVGVIEGKQVDPVNKFLMEGGLEARAFLTDVVLRTNYGKNKEVLSTVKAKKEATKILEKQLQNSASANFAQETSSFGGGDGLWENVIGL